MKRSKKYLCKVLSLILILSIINIPAIKAKADAGTVDDFVERCYTVTLGRGSDPDGFADWKGQLTSGKAVGVHVAYGFLFSPEYTKKNKSPEEYVTDLYMLFMGREPDEAGFKDWVGQLKEGKSKTEVFAGFANSQEFYNICESYGITAGRFVVGYDRFQVNNVNLFVERLYKICLGRIGDRDGQRNWVEKLINKQITGSECARSFIFSQEYSNKGLSDDEFVENLYLAMMGRPSDAGGKSNWLNALASGKTRDEVFAGFANSVEFSNICNTYKIDRGTYTAKNTSNNNNNNNNQTNKAPAAIVNLSNTGNCTIPDNKSKEPAKPKYKEGDVIKFGKYEQDGNTANGKEDIEWVVVEVRDWTVMVVSKYALDCQPYNTTRKDTTWEKSSIRKWLNNDFANAAFTKSELNSIPTVTHENKNNKKYGTKGGNATEDKIFLLSLDDLSYAGMYNAYFAGVEQGLGEQMICEPTKYAISQGASVRTFTSSDYTDPYSKYYSNKAIGKKGTYWWLRDAGSSSKEALYCDDYGFFGGSISNYVDKSYAIRPAMYLSYHDIPKPDEDAVPSIPKLNVGDTFTFGRYEQDNNYYDGKEPIEWIVLEADDHSALLLSRYTLDYKDNYYNNGDLWWLESPLHSWLNTDFMDAAFTYNEKQFIKPVVLPNDNPIWAREYPGMSKEDYVFVLRCADLEKYFGKYQLYYNDKNAGYNENFIVSPTPYAIAQGVSAYTITENEYYRADRYNPSTKTHDFSLSSVYSKDVIGRVSSGFWVRDMNVASNLSCSVNNIGYGGTGYLDTEFNGVGVRPAMYIEY